MRETYDVFKRIDGEFYTYGATTALSLPAVVDRCARAYPGQPVMIRRSRDGKFLHGDAEAMGRIARLIAREQLNPSPLDRASESAAA
jgi:hypothetical protein